jgi:uncharacterized protein YukE
MDYLQFFDEEYSKFNNTISQLNSAYVHSKDIYSNLIASQKELINRISNAPLNLSSLESFMQYVKDFIQNSEELLSQLKDLYNSFIILKSGTDDN